jgi:ankyrin repeat protein
MTGRVRRSVFAVLSVLCASWLCDAAAEAQDAGGPDAFTVMGPINRLPNGGRPQQKAPFPSIVDWNTLKISMSRSPCFGTCPSYSVEIRSDGTILYRGSDFVAISGTHRSRVSLDAVHRLYDDFGKASFFCTFDEYKADITDNPEYVVEISYDGRTKRVVDYVGRAIGMPKQISELEDAIDATAQTKKWVEGDEGTFASLEAEHWDFRAADDEHQRLIASAAGKGTADLVHSLLDAGVSARNKFGCRGLEEAARTPHADTVNRLLAAGAPVHLNASKNNDLEYDCDALSAAAEAGVPRIVQAILSHHPDVNWQNDSGDTALMLAVPGDASEPPRPERDFPAIVKMLIGAGADVNLRDSQGRSAIMKVEESGEIVRMLVAAGAKDINRADWTGQTVLFSVFKAEVAQALLEGGADPWIRDKNGKNAYEVASDTYRDGYEAGPVLKLWMKTHPEVRSQSR